MRMSIKLTLVFLLSIAAISLALPRGVDAQSPDVEISLSSSVTDASVGDVIPLNLSVTYPTDQQVIIPKLPASWGDLEVHNQSRVTVKDNRNGTSVASQTIEAALFVPGTFQTSVLPIRVYASSGEFVEKMAPIISLTIKPTLPETGGILRDINSQANLSILLLWPLALAVLALLILIVTGVFLLVRRLLTTEELTPEQERELKTPYEIAQDDLAGVERLGLTLEGRYKEHYSLITDAVRQYLEGAYELDALDQSTYEIREALRTTLVTADASEKVIEFLESCDLIKFANVIPDNEEAGQSTERARGLIEILTPGGSWTGRSPVRTG